MTILFKFSHVNLYEIVHVNLFGTNDAVAQTMHVGGSLHQVVFSNVGLLISWERVVGDCLRFSHQVRIGQIDIVNDIFP